MDLQIAGIEQAAGFSVAAHHWAGAAGCAIEQLALPGENPVELRKRIDDWYNFYEPSSPIERGLIDQAAMAEIEIARSRRVLATLKSLRLNTAEHEWEFAWEAEIATCCKLLEENCTDAVRRLKRSAAGCRYLVSRWEYLENRLDRDQTWFGADSYTALQLQGYSPVPDAHVVCEESYLFAMYCVMAQPNPSQIEIDVLHMKEVQNVTIRDNLPTPWPPEKEFSRAQLRAVLDRELPALRERAEWLRVTVEEPGRAAVREAAMAQIVKEETQLLREQRRHEQAFQRASEALRKMRKQTAGPNR